MTETRVKPYIARHPSIASRVALFFEVVRVMQINLEYKSRSDLSGGGAYFAAAAEWSLA